MADLRTNIAALLLADFKAEAETGFPTVRRIPSTDAVKFNSLMGCVTRTFAMSEPLSGTQ